MSEKRLANLQEKMAAKGIDTVALVPGPNMVYFKNIHAHLSERPIVLFLPANAEPTIIIPTLEAMKAEAAGIPGTLIFDWNDDEGFAGAFEAASAALDLAGSTLGVEALHMRVLESQQLSSAAPGIKITAAEEIISSLRMIKDEQEVATMDRAVAIAEEAMNTLLPLVRVGMSEKQIAAMLKQALLDAGADDVSFSPIVASGPNSAIPHAVPTERLLQDGELLLFDWGALVDGYASDLTRTFAVGEIDPELKKVYEIVRQANEAGRTAIKPGLPAREVDRATRKIIEEAGYGPYFFHRTGHGLGLEVHEEPNILEGNAQPLQVGNTFTVEPGIYLADRGGVRIEDNILVTGDGYRSQTTFPRDLRNIGSGS